jgi:hypothetical protein
MRIKEFKKRQTKLLIKLINNYLKKSNNSLYLKLICRN